MNDLRVHSCSNSPRAQSIIRVLSDFVMTPVSDSLKPANRNSPLFSTTFFTCSSFVGLPTSFFLSNNPRILEISEGARPKPKLRCAEYALVGASDNLAGRVYNLI